MKQQKKLHLAELNVMGNPLNPLAVISARAQKTFICDTDLSPVHTSTLLTLSPVHSSPLVGVQLSWQHWISTLGMKAGTWTHQTEVGN